MTLDMLLSRARYVALVLPLFALASTIHVGCSGSATGMYYDGYGYGYSGYGGDDP